MSRLRLQRLYHALAGTSVRVSVTAITCIVWTMHVIVVELIDYELPSVGSKSVKISVNKTVCT
jgi:hypothetical protein